jgi:Arc/MetJ-type ribon-helix-helix transcriptional regulator
MGRWPYFASRSPRVVPREPYIPISFPESLVERIDALVAQPEHGFTTRAEFARTALRRFLEIQEKHAYREIALRGPSGKTGKEPILRQLRKKPK